MASIPRHCSTHLILAALGLAIGSAPRESEAQSRRPGDAARRPGISQGTLENGDLAPDFTLATPDGKKTVSLSQLRGKAVVLVFGSCTCPTFVSSTSLLTPLSEQHGDRVHFLMVYIREAHPIGGREVSGNQFQVAMPKTYEEKRRVASAFAERIDFPIPMVVDTIDDEVSKVYAPWPNRLMVIDAAGVIVDKGMAGPGGTRESAKRLPNILDQLLAK
jgi:thiol-disulfide isomerase/thioredoxin